MNTTRIKACDVRHGDRMVFVAKGGDGILEGATVAVVLVESPAEWPGRPAIKVTDGLYPVSSPDEMVEIEQRPATGATITMTDAEFAARLELARTEGSAAMRDHAHRLLLSEENKAWAAEGGDGPGYTAIRALKRRMFAELPRAAFVIERAPTTRDMSNMLASLFDEQWCVLRLTRSVGITDPVWEGCAKEIWDGILDRAASVPCTIQRLFVVAVDEYPTNTRLRDMAQAVAAMPVTTPATRNEAAKTEGAP